MSDPLADRPDQAQPLYFGIGRLSAPRWGAIAAATAATMALVFVLGGPLRDVSLLFLVGLPFGLALAGASGRQWLLPIRLRRAAWTPIREARDGMVAIRGRVAAGGELAFSPVSEREVVWTRLDFIEYRASTGGAQPWVVRSETIARDFLIDDGSGELAHVTVSGASVLGDEILGYTAESPSGALRSFLEARGLGDLLPDGTSRFVVERALCPGDDVIARGPASRGSPDAGAEGGAPASVILRAEPRRREQLIVSPWPLSPPGFPPIALILGLLLSIGSLAPLALTLSSRLRGGR